METHVQFGIILIYQTYGLLNLPVIINLRQPTETPDPVIDMHHVITGMQVLQFADRDGLPPFPNLRSLQTVFLVTIENLMFRVNTHLDLGIAESLVNRSLHGYKIHLMPLIRENIPQPLELHIVRGTKINRVLIHLLVQQMLCQQIKLLVHGWLHLRLQTNHLAPEKQFRPPLHHIIPLDRPEQTIRRDQELSGIQLF